MVILKSPEMISHNAFGSADWLKVQSQHERFLREIRNLPKEEKVEEMINAIKYLIQNKSDYWLETAHFIDVLMSKENENDEEYWFQIIAPGLTKTKFCVDYLGLTIQAVNSYLRVIRNYEKYGFTEEQIRVLGLSKTLDILKSENPLSISRYTKQTIEQLKDLTRADIRVKKQKPISEILWHYWEKASEKDRKQFLGRIEKRKMCNGASGVYLVKNNKEEEKTK